MSEQVVLVIDGLVERPLRLTFDQLDSLPEPARVTDVSRFHPRRRGDGVTLDAVLQRAGVRPEANYATLHADRDDFHVSVPLEPLRQQGVIVYRLGNGRLAIEDGGPIRFIVRDPTACHTGELDECANVKYLSRIELTTRRGRDTRPSSEAEHEALHRAQSATGGPGASEPPSKQVDQPHAQHGERDGGGTDGRDEHSGGGDLAGGLEPVLLGVADSAGQRVDGAMGQLRQQHDAGAQREQAPAA